MVRSPTSLNSQGVENPKPLAEGVEGLDPQLDTPVDSGPKRTMTPIGAPSSPIAPTGLSFDVGFVGAAGHRQAYVSPLASSLPGYSLPERRLQSWTTWEAGEDEPRINTLGTTQSNSTRSIAEAAADDVLNESIESLNLDPPLLPRGATRIPAVTVPSVSLPTVAFSNGPPLVISPPVRSPPVASLPPVSLPAVSLPPHQLVHNTVASPYEQQHILDRQLYPNEGRTHSVQSPSTPHRDSAPRSRSVLVRNLPPGVDDESLRTLLGQYGELRDLGAQQRVRGGRGSVVATYFDLRDACAAFGALDGTFHYGRRIEVRFHSLIHSMPRSPLQPQNGPDSGDATSPRRGANGKRADSQNASSPQSPNKPALPSPSNHGTLVVFNLDPSTTAEEIRALFGSIGDVKEIRSTPNKRHHKFVEFFDVRDAERALTALNKTEVGGKKIKIEISRPGGRGSHNPRHNSGSHSAGHRYEDNRGHTNGHSAQQQQYGNVRTPPNVPTAGYSASAHSRPDPSLAFSPLEGSAASPYSTSFPSIPSNDGSRARSGGLSSLDVGNTIPQDRPFLSAPSGVAPLSPSTDFYNSLRHNQMSPYSSSDMPDISNLHIGNSVGGELLNFDALGRASAPGDGVYEGNSSQIRTAGNNWSNYPPVYSASPDDLRKLDNVGIPISGSTIDPTSQTYIGSGRFLAQSAPRENGFGLQARADDSDFHRNPSFSPRSLRAMPSTSRGYQRVLDVGASNPSYSHDGFVGGPKSPDAANRTLRTPARRFSEAASTTPITKEVAASTPMKEAQPPQRKYSYSTVLRMNGQEAAARRANLNANRTSQSAPTGNTCHPTNNSNAKNCLDIAKVISGEDTRTALMIRNIPNKYNQRMLLNALDEHHRGHFDFIYLPIDFKNKCNVGYAFINFTSTRHIPAFYHEFHGHKWGRFNSEKVCEICYARIQGKNALIAHFQNSSLMHEDPKCRPVILSNGKPEEFPVGTNVRTRRGPSVRDSHRLAHEQSPPFSPKPRGRLH